MLKVNLVLDEEARASHAHDASFPPLGDGMGPSPWSSLLRQPGAPGSDSLSDFSSNPRDPVHGHRHGCSKRQLSPGVQEWPAHPGVTNDGATRLVHTLLHTRVTNSEMTHKLSLHVAAGWGSLHPDAISLPIDPPQMRGAGWQLPNQRPQLTSEGTESTGAKNRLEGTCAKKRVNIYGGLPHNTPPGDCCPPP